MGEMYLILKVNGVEMIELIGIIYKALDIGLIGVDVHILPHRQVIGFIGQVGLELGIYLEALFIVSLVTAGLKQLVNLGIIDAR